SVGRIVGAIAAASLLIVGTWAPNTIAGYVPCFLAGVLAYAIARSFAPRVSGWLWPAFLLLVVVGFVLVQRKDPEELKHYVIDWIASIVVGLAIPCFMEIRANWLRIVSGKIARYSYGIYLAHTPLIWLCFIRLAMLPLSARVVLF